MTRRAGRAAVPGLASPHPFAGRLPEVYAESDFAVRFTAAFDDLLAPVHVTLDCLDSYFDPRLAPVDFLDWLAGWVLAGDTAQLSEERRRTAVGEALTAHRRRGTLAGLTARLSLLGIDAEVRDSGGTAWSATPNGPLPGTARGPLVVRPRLPEDPAGCLRVVASVVDEHRPAHVPCLIEPAGER
ncbi:phage tail protein [Streptomyces sp. LARHCF249]